MPLPGALASSTIFSTSDGRQVVDHEPAEVLEHVAPPASGPRPTSPVMTTNSVTAVSVPTASAGQPVATLRARR